MNAQERQRRYDGRLGFKEEWENDCSWVGGVMPFGIFAVLGLLLVPIFVTAAIYTGNWHSLWWPGGLMIVGAGLQAILLPFWFDTRQRYWETYRKEPPLW